MKPIFKTFPHSTADWRAASYFKREVLAQTIWESGFYAPKSWKQKKITFIIIGLINESWLLLAGIGVLKHQTKNATGGFFPFNIEILNWVTDDKLCEVFMLLQIGVNILYCHRETVAGYFLS